MPTASITLADALDGLRALPDNSVDAVITDPPYGLTDISAKKLTDALLRWTGGERDYVPAGRGFMNNAWDRFVPPPALWDEAFRVLKPGGYLVSFSGARTVDLMGLSIRLAGFRVKDIAAWIRSDAFAKTPNSLKPGHEPIVMAQKPLEGTVEQNVERWGTGGLNIEDSRTPYISEADEAETKTKNAHGKFGTRHGGNAVFGNFGDDLREDYNAPGRWPSNTLLSEEAAAGLNAAYPVTKSRKGKPREGAAGDGWGTTKSGTEHNDVGGPARFFPLITEEPDPISDAFTEMRFAYAGRAPVKERPVADDGTKHPTVKPLSVMRWLVRLVAPKDAIVLDMFAGSGTTLEAAVLEGRDVIGFESHAPFMPLIDQRLDRCGADRG
jgi:site-specific DNA-methyltransferase (adenine-specific)